MFFYTALFVASVIAALVILYLYKAIVGAGKAVYSSILPSRKDNRTLQTPSEQPVTTINETLTPWGWKERSTPVKTERNRFALPSGKTPWGWKGNSSHTHSRASRGAKSNKPAMAFGSFSGIKGGESSSNTSRNSRVGWPYREEKFEFAGKAYKVTRKAKPARTNLSKSSKPWGW